MVCYVCEGDIKGDPVYIGQDKYRHKRCMPGSARWLRSKISKRSKLRPFFLLGSKKREEEEIQP